MNQLARLINFNGLYDMYTDGVPLRVIAARHNITAAYVSYLAHKAGLPHRQRGGWNRGMKGWRKDRYMRNYYGTP